MPNLNGTGPMNKGPMTGKSLGKCAGVSNKTFNSSNFGERQGTGRMRGKRDGCGRGFGYGFRGAQLKITPENEKNHLSTELNLLETEVERIKKRLCDLNL